MASLAEMIESGASELRRGSRQSLRYIVFLPVLVVSDETLWVADCSPRGELQREPSQVPKLTYYLGRQYALDRRSVILTISHLHIITRSEFWTWLHGIAQGSGIWQELFPST